MQVHNPYAREDAISRLRDERDAEMRRADAADDLVAELRAERAAALARAEAVEARALAEHQAAADLLAVIARIGECLGIPYSKPDLCHAVEAEVKRLRARVAELETALAAERAAHAWRPVLELPPVGTLCTLRVDAGVFLVDGFNAPSRDYEPVAIRVSGWRDIAHPVPGYSYRLKPAPRRPTRKTWNRTQGSTNRPLPH